MQDRTPMPDQYLSTADVFDLARSLAAGFTQAEIRRELAARLGRHVSQPAVAQMLQGRQQMLKLALAWIELRSNSPEAFERRADEPVRYYRLRVAAEAG